MASSAETEEGNVAGISTARVGRPQVGRPQVGRRRATTQHDITGVAIELFATRGFDEVSVDDVAAAAGISRRTLFRYYPSKSAIPWGDFDSHLEQMRDLLESIDPAVSTRDALRTALLEFNSWDPQETAQHRMRMRVILETTELQAYSMTMYGGWRSVVAAFVAQRTDARPADLAPQTVAWTMLGVALSAYEYWLADESVSLTDALGHAFDLVSDGLAAI